MRRMDADEFDLIAVGRSLLANADFVQKVRDRRFDEVVVFNKELHIPKFVEEYDAGAVGESRKTAD